jgi:hypothetical protein
MVSFNSEETLHHYLRRYFERVCKTKERRFAEEKEVALPSAIETLLADTTGS